MLSYLLFAILYFYYDHQLPFFKPPKKAENGRLVIMSETMIWMEIQIMMIPVAMIYVLILQIQKRAHESHNAHCSRPHLEPLMQEGGGAQQSLDETTNVNVGEVRKNPVGHVQKQQQDGQSDSAKKLCLNKDYISFTILCFYRVNCRNFKIDQRYRSKLILNNVLLISLQLCLVSALGFEIIKDDTDTFEVKQQSFRLFVSKFISSICMHMQIFREFINGQNILRFLITHKANFHNSGILYFLGISRMLFCFLYEYINMFILFSRETVYLTMVSFFTVNLLINISMFYYNKIIGEDMGNVLRHVFDEERLPQDQQVIAKKVEKDGSYVGPD